MAPSSDDSSLSDSPPSSSSSSSSDSSSNSPPSNSGNSGSSSNNNSGGNNSNDSSGGNNNDNNSSGNNNNSGGNDNSKGDSDGDKGSSGKDDSGQSSNNNNSSGQSDGNNNNNVSGQNSNSNSGQNNNKNSGQSNNDSNNNNSGQNNNNNNNNNNNSGQNNNNQNNNNNQSKNGNKNNSGGNSNSQTSQGNHPPPPPKSSSTYWRAPPPPLSSRKSPPTTTLSGGDDKASPSPSRSSSNTSILIGLIAGVGFLFFIIIFLILSCAKRRKRRQSSHLMDNPDPYRRNSSDYWQSGPYKPNEHILNMPQPPLTSGWNNQGGPPMVSSEMNSSNFSGPHGPPLPPPHPSMALGFNTSTFTYEDLAAATSGFSQAKLLGQGGFGFVHKGLLPNGKEIAVKSLKAGSGQGDREFAAEVEIISRVHHRHLVSLVGYCINGERKLLVYEFVPNNNLEFHLHNKNRPPLEWDSRVKIALGSAKGLAYLHEDCHPKIIHRDIKTANILIDYNFEAKVADFGLAKLNQENVTHVSTRVMGTFGYLAPEYASSGKLTEKSDVFSFSIMLLELITGRRPIDTSGDYEEDTLVDWARPLCLKALEDGNYSELVDPRLENKYDHEEMARMVACASSGIRHSARKRPKMSQIVRALEGDVSLEDLHQGIKPSPSALFNGSTTSSEFEADSYNANMKNFRKATLGESQDYPSSEFGGNTSNSEEMVKKL